MIELYFDCSERDCHCVRMLSKLNNTYKMPLLQHWGQKVTTKMFGGKNRLSAESRKALLDTINEINAPNTNQVPLIKPNAPKIISSLPYVLGYACATGKISKQKVDLTKPILVVGSGDKRMSKLDNILSAHKRIKYPYLQQRGFLSKLDKLSGAYYRTYSVKNSSDAKRLPVKKGQYDILLCSDRLSEYLPDNSFSLVVADGKASLNEDAIRDKFEGHCKVVVLRHNQNKHQGKSTSPRNSSSPTPILVELSKVFTKERILPFLSEHQAKAMDNVEEHLSDGSLNHIPIEINANFNQGIQTFLATFPYLIGCAGRSSKSDLDLHKPLLMMATDDDSWALLKQVTKMDESSYLVMAGLTTEEELDDGLHYNSHLIEDDFDLSTYSRETHRDQIILARQEMVTCPGKKSRKCLEATSFSAVLVVKSITGDIDFERKLMRKFSGLPLTFMRINEQQDIQIEVPSLLSTVKHFGAESITPPLAKHCKCIIQCGYLLGENSILDSDQQQFLTSMLDWLTGNERQVKFRTRFGYDKAVQALQCLPSLLEWAKENQLVSPSNLKYDKPVLIIGSTSNTLSDISSIHKPVETAKMKCQHYKFSRLSDSEWGTNFTDDATVLSEMTHLKKLSNNCFPVVIIFSEKELRNEIMQKITHKFGSNTKLVFYEAYNAKENANHLEKYSANSHLHTLSRFSRSECSSQGTSLMHSVTDAHTVEKILYDSIEAMEVTETKDTDVSINYTNFRSDSSGIDTCQLMEEVESQIADENANAPAIQNHLSTDNRKSLGVKSQNTEVRSVLDDVTYSNSSTATGDNNNTLKRSAAFISVGNEWDEKWFEDFSLANVSKTNSTESLYLNESHNYNKEISNSYENFTNEIISPQGTQKYQNFVHAEFSATNIEEDIEFANTVQQSTSKSCDSSPALLRKLKRDSLESFYVPPQDSIECLVLEPSYTEVPNPFFTKAKTRNTNHQPFIAPYINRQPFIEQFFSKKALSNKATTDEVAIAGSVEHLSLQPNEREYYNSATVNLVHTSSIETLYLEPHGMMSTRRNIADTIEELESQNTESILEGNEVMGKTSSIETIYLEPQSSECKASKPPTIVDRNNTICEIAHSESIESIYLETANLNPCISNSNDNAGVSDEVECFIATQGKEDYNKNGDNADMKSAGTIYSIKPCYHNGLISTGTKNSTETTSSQLEQTLSRALDENKAASCRDMSHVREAEFSCNMIIASPKLIHVKPLYDSMETCFED